VRDDDARDLGPREVVRHALREALPRGLVHVLAVDGRDRLRFEPVPGQRRHARHEGVDAQRAGTVAGGVGGEGGAAGDRPARGEDHDERLGALHSWQPWI